jgi:type IV pilus assembly protein PilM
MDRNAMQVDFIRTGAGSNGNAQPAQPATENREEILLIAASHAAINSRLEPILQAGLRPIAVETGFSALGRMFSRHARREADRGQVRAVIEIGYSGSTVMILRGDQIAFCKPISVSGQSFNQAVAEHLQIDVRAASELRAARIAAAITGTQSAHAAAAPAGQAGSTPASEAATDRAVFEAVRPLMGDLVKEVMLCLRYYGVTFRGHPPDRVILTGGDGREPRLAQVFTQSCKLPVEFDDLPGTLGTLLPEIQNTLNRTPGPAACWSAAVGLSLRGMPRRKGMRDIAPPEPARKAVAA